jgi:hypothetical protein
MKQPCTSTAQIHSLLLFGRFPRCTIFFQFWEAGQFDQSPEQVIRPTMTARTLVALPFQPNYNGPHIPRAPVSGPGEIDRAVNPSNGWKSRIFPVSVRPFFLVRTFAPQHAEPMEFQKIDLFS